jgi:hypothetical protein
MFKPEGKNTLGGFFKNITEDVSRYTVVETERT